METSVDCQSLRKMLGVTVVSILTTFLVASAAQTVDVSTPLGKIVGKVEENSIISFLGVPYASAPVGDLRFRLPKSPATWNGTLNATRHGPVCYQAHFPLGIEKVLRNQSEDCLTLDIYVDGTMIDDKRNMPVLVYVHGGGFIFGSALEYEMNKFVAGKGIIAVVIQYRLGLLGFAKSPDDEMITGNNGLHDQVAAIKWVKEYIKSFGGDGESITLAGESAGSISIAHHLVSPLSVGLFKRAILESGSHATMRLMSEEKVRSNMKNLIEKAGCNKTGDEREAYECLRSLPIDKLNGAYNALKPFLSLGLFSGTSFLPTLDSRFFENTDPVDKVKSGNFTSKLDSLIIGHNGNEGALFLMFSAPTIFPILTRPMRKYRTKLEVQALSLTLNKNFRDKFRQLVNLTFEDRLYMKANEMFNRMGKIAGDETFACSNRDFVESYLKFNPTTKVFYYHFIYRPKGKTIAPYIEEALHGEEVSYVYGRILQKPKSLSADDEKFSKALVNEWTNFVKTGSVANEKWTSASYSQEEVKFNHMAFVSPSRIEQRSGFPENFCRDFKSS